MSPNQNYNKNKSAKQQITKKKKKIEKTEAWKAGTLELTSPPAIPHPTVVQTEETEEKKKKKNDIRRRLEMQRWEERKMKK